MRLLKAKDREDDLFQEVARARDRLMLILATSPWPAFKNKTQLLERDFSRRAANEKQRLEIRRRFAGDRLDGAVTAEVGRRQILALFARVEKLGYSNLVHQHHVVSILVRWTAQTGVARVESERALKALEGRVRRSRADADTRRRILESISTKWALLSSGASPERGLL